MRDQDRDNQAPRPYRTYKAGRGRRSSLDEELSGTRPPRQKPAARSRPEPAGAPAGYQRYGSTPGASRPRGAARRRRFRWWHVPVGLFALLTVATVVLVVLAWPGYAKFDRAVERSNARIDRKTHAQLSPDDGWLLRSGTTILLLGVDSKAGEPARSDTIMLMRFDPRSRTISQLSIPRDTRVDIPGRGPDKINAAMYWGGPALAVKTVRQYLGIPVNHVMVVNFQGFPRLVNAVGGVDINVRETVTTTAGSNARVVVFEEGPQHFDGKYAMLYVRARKSDDDFHRAERQQQFVAALQKKIARPSNITKLPDIGRRFMNGVDTDLTTNQILALSYMKWRANRNRKMVLLGEPTYIGGVAYVLPSEADKERAVRRFLRD
jgi:LCP family protein required for cell wall assembly